MKDLYGTELNVGDKVVFKYTPFRDTVYLRIATIERFGKVGGFDVAYLKDAQWIGNDLNNYPAAKVSYRYCADIIKAA